jgi:hypothetical protein
MGRRKILTLGIILGFVVSSMIAWLVLSQDPSSLEPQLRAAWDDAIGEAEQMRVRILCELDHQELLRAGREVLSRIPPAVLQERPLEPGERRSLEFFQIPPDIPRPEIIRSLRPNGFVVTSRGYLSMEMHGGMDHFGLYVYPEGYKTQGSDYYGDRQLIPGLWYYDDGYLHNPNYDKRIDALIEAHRARSEIVTDEPARQ